MKKNNKKSGLLLVGIMTMSLLIIIPVKASPIMDISMFVYNLDVNDDWDDGWRDGAEIYIRIKCKIGSSWDAESSYTQPGKSLFEVYTPGEWDDHDRDEDNDELKDDLAVSKNEMCEAGNDHFAIELRELDSPFYEVMVEWEFYDVPSNTVTDLYTMSDGDVEYSIQISWTLD